MQNEKHKEECYKNRCKSRIHFFLPICCTILITLLSSCNTQSTKTSDLESLTRNTPPDTLKRFGTTVNGTSFCRNCIEDKIVFDEEFREHRDILLESILADSHIGYDLHSESDCQSSDFAVCRNCVEDKIDISNPSTKGKLIEIILAGGDSRYNLHSESDCQSSE